MSTRWSLIAFASLTPSLLSQNTTLLSRFDTRAAYAGVWGYASPDGREFAIVGERTGTWIVETTDPLNPKEIGHYTAASSTWREMTSYGPYIYSVSENHAGIRVLDMTNPSSPVDRGVVHQTTWTRTHSISIDPDAGRLYANGTNGGMYILDVSTTPTAPTVLGRYTAYYVHDSFFRRGKGYLAQINNGFLRIVNATNPANLTTISATTTPGSFTHNAAVSDDDTLLLTTDENNTGYLQLYDITNPGSPVAKGSYRVTGSIVHNVFLIGRTAHISHYTDGYHMVDVSNPDAPARLARYDTSTSASGYNGAWGCYPFQDSGVVYVSDIQNGLFCFQVDCGHMNRFGGATPGTGGAVPRLTIPKAPPKVGAAGFELQVSGAAPNTVYVAFFGQKGSLQALGIDIHVDLGAPFVAFVGLADANGQAAFPIPLANDPGLGGIKLYAQVITVDTAGPQGLAASRGHWFGICP